MSRRFLLIAMLIVVACGAGFAVWWKFLREPTPIFRIHRDIEYAKVGDRSLKLDLYLPTDRGVRPPVVLWLHGGSWQYGDKNHNPLRWLAMEGYAVAVIDYRLSGEATFPAAIHDCKAAVRWLRGNADEWEYDARNVIAAGASAGGHLALLLGTTGHVAAIEGDLGDHRDQSSAVAGVISFAGIGDLNQYTEAGSDPLREAVRLFLGRRVEDRPELARQASPREQLDSGDAPLLILHGLDDDVVPIEHSRQLATAWQEAGVACELVQVPGQGHDGPLFYDDARRPFVRAFLQRYAPRGGPR